jgi:hypothetical protein
MLKSIRPLFPQLAAGDLDTERVSLLRTSSRCRIVSCESLNYQGRLAASVQTSYLVAVLGISGSFSATPQKASAGLTCVSDRTVHIACRIVPASATATAVMLTQNGSRCPARRWRQGSRRSRGPLPRCVPASRRERLCRPHVHRPRRRTGRDGFEAFDRCNKSLGIYDTVALAANATREAALALIDAIEDGSCDGA